MKSLFAPYDFLTIANLPFELVAIMRNQLKSITSRGSEVSEQPLEITVVFTNTRATLTALRTAAGLAASLAARITLLAPQVVPFPLPLSSPPVSLQWSRRRFHELVAGQPVETNVDICLCRDATEFLLGALKPRSIVVIGGRKRWWPTAENTLANQLCAEGHEVVLAPVR